MHHLSICSKCGYGHSSDTCVTDDEVVAWFDSQSEEFLAAVPGYEDGLTPRRAWNEFFSSSPATEAAPASSPAPVVAGQGEGTIYRPIREYLEWLYSEQVRLDGTPSNPAYRECQAALRVYMRFVAHRLEQVA